MANDELERLLAEGKTARARQILKERSTSPPSNGSRSPYPVLLLFVVLAAVAVGTILGLVYVGVNALEFLQPLLGVLFTWGGPWLLSPVALATLGLAILAVGLPRAERFRRPSRFRVGIIAFALAFITFWPLQFLAGRVDVSFAEYRTALHLLAAFVSVCLLTGGIEGIRMANNTVNDDSWEFLR